MTSRYSEDLNEMREYFKSGETLSVGFRKKQLNQLIALINENSKALTDAIFKDIKRCEAEADCFELVQILNDANTFLANLDEWTKPTHVERGLLQLMDPAAYIKKDPLGVCLIIATWNYPILMSFLPLVGAIGAGNCAVIKPSEIAPHSADLIAELVPKYFESKYIRVITGGVPENTELLKEPFDHIFFTGASSVAKIIMSAAAKHLTPVVLELGGQCPTFIDRNMDLKVVGRRIAWGKFITCGQTCLAPNHILCYKEDEQAIIDSIVAAVREYYGDNPQQSLDYSRIISRRHFDRLSMMLSKSSGKVAFGGESDADDLFIHPTILTDVKPDDSTMEDEIFGPILPIITMDSLKDGVRVVQKGRKPLALYIFSNDQSTIDYTLKHTSSVDTLPFGGVGNSGIGRYHGKFSFDTYTHEKSVLQRRTFGESLLWMRYPPYDEKKQWWAKKMGQKRTVPRIFKLFPILIPAILGVLFGYFYANYRENVNLASFKRK